MNWATLLEGDAYSLVISCAGLALKVSILLGACWAALRIIGNISSTARHAIWTVAFAGALALPLFEAVLPSWPLITLAAPPAAPRDSADESSPAWGSAGDPNVVRGTQGASHRVAARTPPVVTTLGGRALRSALADVPWTLAATVIWCAGAAILLARTIVGVLVLRRVVRRARPIEDATWGAVVERARRAVGLRRQTPVLVTAEAVTPFVTGVFRPVVVISQGAAAWRRHRRWAVLVHEFAHVARRDAVADAVARLVCIFYWCNPLVWVCRRSQVFERERACDDVVLQNGVSPADYAQQILNVASAYRPRRAIPAAMAMARPSDLEGRVLSILDGPRRRRRTSRRGCAAAVAGTALAALPIASISWSTPSAAAANATSDPATTDPGGGEWRFQDPETIDWAVDDYVRGLRSSDEAQRSRAERTIRSLDAQDAIVEGVVDQLLDDLASTDARTRHAAVWQLEKTRSPRAYEALVDRLGDESPLVRGGAAGALGEFSDARAIGPLASLAADSDAKVRTWSARALGNFREPQVSDALHAFTEDADAETREWAVRSLANVGDPDTVDTFVDKLQDEDANVREWAARSLGQIRNPRAVEPLIEALQDSGANVREWSARTLAEYEDPRAVDPLIDNLSDASADVRQWSARSLGRLASPDAVDALEASIVDPNAEVQEWATRALGQIDGPEAGDALSRALHAQSGEVQYWAARGLGNRDDAGSAKSLRNALLDETVSAAARAEAVRALGRRQDRDSFNELIESLHDSSSEVRREAVRAVSRIDGVAALEDLSYVLFEDANPKVRVAAARSLGRLGTPAATDALRDALFDDDVDVIAEATSSLAEIGSEDAMEALLSRLLSGDFVGEQAAIRALVEADSPFANRVLEYALEEAGPARARLRTWIADARMRSDPFLYFTARFPNDDPWVVLARTYVASYDIDESDALNLARKAVKKRDKFLKDKKGQEQARLDEWVKKLQKFYLIDGLERMAARARQKRTAD